MGGLDFVKLSPSDPIQTLPALLLLWPEMPSGLGCLASASFFQRGRRPFSQTKMARPVSHLLRHDSPVVDDQCIVISLEWIAVYIFNPLYSLGLPPVYSGQIPMLRPLQNDISLPPQSHCLLVQEISGH